jgi:hypothetical protein
MTVRQARELVDKRDTNARRKATRAANKAKKAAEAAKEAAKAAEKAAKKAKTTRRRTTATPPDPEPAPPAPVNPGPQSGLHLVPNSTDDQRQYLGRDSTDGSPGAGPDGQRAPLRWSIYGSAVQSMLTAVEQGRVPTVEELRQLREALAKVEALAAT